MRILQYIVTVVIAAGAFDLWAGSTNTVAALALPSMAGAAREDTQGFSVKELNAFLVQAEHQIPQDELVAEIACRGKKWEIITVKAPGARGQRISFGKVDKEWQKERSGSYPGDSAKGQQPNMAVTEICDCFVLFEGMLPRDEGIVGFKIFEDKILVRTAGVSDPPAGRGHSIIFKRVDGEWKQTAHHEWIS